MFTLTPSAFGGPTRLRIDGDLSIYQASAVRDAFVALLPLHADAWQLDLGCIDDFDSAGLQLLLVIQRTLCQGGSPVTVVDAAPAVRETIALLRLESLFPNARIED
ncbi:STAS domain-containing protein [Pseudomonas poae]|nr:STAS domain-containing protein [Pseudomonas poae]